MNNIVSGLYAVYIAYNVNVLLLYLTTLCRLKSADRVFWLCFPAKNHTWQAKPYSPMTEKEYIYVWLVIHYLDFDSVEPYYECSQQLEIDN